MAVDLQAMAPIPGVIQLQGDITQVPPQCRIYSIPCALFVYSMYYYRPQGKGNVFTGVCLYKGGGLGYLFYQVRSKG